MTVIFHNGMELVSVLENLRHLYSCQDRLPDFVTQSCLALCFSRIFGLLLQGFESREEITLQ